MPIFLIRTELSRDGLRLFLNNSDGYPSDAFSVRWTIYSHDGTQISGKSLPAIRATCGEYYASWVSNTHNGNYDVNWEIQAESGGPVQSITDKIFVLDPSSYRTSSIHADAIPVSGGLAYMTGTPLGRGDLPLFLRNGDGVLTDAYAVYWTIDPGPPPPPCFIPPSHTVASHAATGEYYAAWTASGCTGNHVIKWEWMADATSPLESKLMPFSIINPGMPYIYPYGPAPRPCGLIPCTPCGHLPAPYPRCPRHG